MLLLSKNILFEKQLLKGRLISVHDQITIGDNTQVKLRHGIYSNMVWFVRNLA